MIRDDIVRMAREIGMDEVDPGIFMFEDYELKQLFDQVFDAGAAAERETIIQLIDEMRHIDRDGIIDAIRARR